MRLIDADKFVLALMDASLSSVDEDTILDLVDSISTVDAVPVTRCKDCEKSGVTELGKRYCKEPMGSFFGCIPVEDDYFCSGGRRKDGGNG